MGEGPAALGAEGHARLPKQTRVCSPALALPGGPVARRPCRGHGGGAATWMSEAAAGICLLKCFCLCFCWTFRAKPEPRIPWKDRRQAHALQMRERAAGELGALGPAPRCRPRRPGQCLQRACAWRASWGSEWATSGCLLTGWPPPPPASRAEGPWRRRTNPEHTYRRERKEGDGEDGEAGGDGLPHPRLRHLVPVADGGDRDLWAGGQQAAVSPRTSGRASVQPEAPPPETCCVQRPGREPCTDGLGSSEARAPAHRVWSPNLMLQRKQVHGVCTGARPPYTTPAPCQGGPPPRRPGAPPPLRPTLHREPGHRWHAASRCQPRHQMLYVPFFLGEPDERSSPWG